MRQLLTFVLAIALAGCADVECSSVGLPPGDQAYAAFGGSQVGNTLLAMAQIAGKGAGVFGGPKDGEGATTQPNGPGCNISYKVPPIFGNDYVQTGISVPAAPSTTINNNQGGIINMPPAH
jgi:hypothetical protein